MVARKSPPQADPPGNPDDDAHDEEMQRALGHEIRSLRHKHGLSITELSRQADISPGMLSKIENGSISASLSTLRSVAKALNVPMSAFFAAYEQKRDASWVRAGKGLTIERRGSQAGHLYQLLGHSIRSSISVEPFLVTLEKGADAYPVFQHSGIEFIYMLQGEMTYRHANKTYLLKPGDSLFFDPEAFHGPEQLKKFPIRFLSVISSATNQGHE